MSIIGDHLRDDCMRGMNDIAFDAEMEGCVHEELVRLRAEVASAAKMCDSYAVENQRISDERDRLRAEVALLTEHHPKRVKNIDFREERDRLRAEVATAKRDALEAKQDVCDLLGLKDDNKRLRKLLQDALHYVLKGNAIFLADRIDAALEKQEKEGS